MRKVWERGTLRVLPCGPNKRGPVTKYSEVAIGGGGAGGEDRALSNKCAYREGVGDVTCVPFPPG